jgi:YVTN family beta-propeller protein
MWWLRAFLVLALGGLLLAPRPAQAASQAQREPELADPPTGEFSPNAALAPELASMALSESDVPSTLQVFSRSGSGATGEGGAPFYAVTFLVNGLSPAAPPGTVVSVHNLLTVARNPLLGLDRLMHDAKQGWGSTTDLPPPAVGEESRAAASVASPQSATPLVSSAGVVFRRHDTLVRVAVSVIGSGPPIDEAVRLAQLVDARVLATADSAVAAPPLPPTPSASSDPGPGSAAEGGATASASDSSLAESDATPHLRAAEGPYAASHVGGTVIVMDRGSNTVVATIPVEPEHFLLGMNRAGTRLYLVNRTTDILSVIDTATHDVLHTVLIGRVQIPPAASDGDTRLYIANLLPDTVLAIDARTGSVIATVEIDRLIGEMVVNPAGTRLYIGSLQDEGPATAVLVSVVDTDSRQVIARVPLGASTVAFDRRVVLAMNPTGTRLYAASGGFVFVVDTASDTVLATIPTVRDPDKLLVGSDGARLYVAHSISSTVAVIDTAANTVIATVPIGALTDPTRVALTSNQACGILRSWWHWPEREAEAVRTLPVSAESC